jgi:hypothetical protein
VLVPWGVVWGSGPGGGSGFWTPAHTQQQAHSTQHEQVRSAGRGTHLISYNWRTRVTTYAGITPGQEGWVGGACGNQKKTGRWGSARIASFRWISDWVGQYLRIKITGRWRGVTHENQQQGCARFVFVRGCACELPSEPRVLLLVHGMCVERQCKLHRRSPSC